MHYQRWYKYGDPLKGRVPNGDAIAECMRLLDSPPPEDCVIWPFTRNRKGYGMVNIGGSQRFVHRLLCEEVHGPQPTEEHQVAHSCGNGWGGCVNPSHLRWATSAENAEDRDKHGKQVRGDTCSYAKLTSEAVADIRALRGIVSQSQLARRYGVTQSAVWSAQVGKSWK